MRVFTLMRRAAFPIAALCVLAGVAGCSTQADASLAKKTFPRTTVPAVQTTGGNGPSNDTGGGGAITADKLRQMDPCGLLDPNTLSAVGTPSNDEPEGFATCRNDMKDPQGNNLDLDLFIDDPLTADQASTQMDGLQVTEEKDSGQESSLCREGIITQTGPTLGVVLEVDEDGQDPCVAAKKLASAIVNHMRTNPPLRANAQGSLSEIDPCGTVDDQTAQAAIGSAQKTLYSLYQCKWDNDALTMSVTFDSEGDPAQASGSTQSTPTPVDLGGGITGYQLLSTDIYPDCTIKWIVKKGGDTSNNDVVAVEFGDIDGQKLDTCAKLLPVAKAVASKVPKAS